MKEYETWEVIKMLGENPKLRATNNKKIGVTGEDGGTVGANIIGIIMNSLAWITPQGIVFNLFHINKKTMAMKWQLVREPVTWQEALQAWIDGKTVRCVIFTKDSGCPNEIERVFKCSDFLVNDDKEPPYKIHFTHGTWYIEDNADE